MESASGGTDRGSRFRGLAEYNQYPEINPKKKRQTIGLNEFIDSKTGFVVAEKQYAEYYIVELIEDKKTFDHISPFFVEKALTSHIGNNHQTKCLRNGSLLVKCKNEKQANLLLGFNNILFGNTYKVKVIEHGSLNTVQGIIFCNVSKRLSEADILEGLAHQKVTAVRKLKKKVGNDLVDTGNVVLTFKKSNLPNEIKFGYLSVIVRTYIPNPLRCINCFKFGHTRNHCKKERICALCSDLYHEPNPCTHGSKCTNCDGEHTNWNKECPKFKREVAINAIKVQEKISYFDAKNKYESFNVPVSSLVTLESVHKPSYSQSLSLNSHNSFIPLHPPKKSSIPQNNIVSTQSSINDKKRKNINLNSTQKTDNTKPLNSIVLQNQAQSSACASTNRSHSVNTNSHSHTLNISDSDSSVGACADRRAMSRCTSNTNAVDQTSPNLLSLSLPPSPTNIDIKNTSDKVVSRSRGENHKSLSLSTRSRSNSQKRYSKNEQKTLDSL